MNTAPTRNGRPRSSERMLTFRSGGYVLVIAAVIGAALLAWGIAPALLRNVDRPPGDGQNPETYGFDLSNLIVERDAFVAALLHREIIPVMDDPTVLTEQAVLDMQATREKYLVSSDIVVGVEINGEARAYPMLVLTNHEIVNDELGGRPIAVTYHPLSDAVAVFDRRPVQRDGGRAGGSEALRFGASGLLYNSSQVMYDRDDAAGEAAGDESLWSQVLAEPISGPAAKAGLSLDRVPAQVVTWAQWRQSHPETTVIARDPSFMKRYKKVTYASYFESDAIWFPLTRNPPADGPHVKARVITVYAGDAQRSYLFKELLRRIEQDVTGGDEQSWSDTIGGVSVTFSGPEIEAETVRVTTADGDAVVVTRLLWFVHHAMFPEVAPVGLQDSTDRSG